MMKTITIGRSSKCDIIIENEKISRVHAEVSLVGNQYVYKDLSKNGTNIGGRMVYNEKVSVAPESTILMANAIPLPWAQVFAMLPKTGYRPYSNETVRSGNINETMIEENTPVYYDDSYKEDKLGIGWGILAFIIPIAGWIMYFVWKDETPDRAGTAGLLGTISFVINLIGLFAL